MKRHRAARGRPLAVTLALLLVATLGTAAARTGPESSRPHTPDQATSDPVALYQVRLITGDEVIVEVGPAGHRNVTLTPQGRQPGPASYQHYAIEDQIYVIPSDAAPLIPDVLDMELFNVTKLTAAGFADATPVIVQHTAGPRTMSAVPTQGLTATAELASIDAVAATVAPDGQWWETVTATPASGPRTLAQTAAPGGLAGVERVWLDEPMQVQLADSVPQIGAPQAWDSGYDGSGLTVAVLDTGIDENHPDLDGKVVAAENFTTTDSATDRHGHGTHVGSTIAGSGAASDGARRGVAPGAELINGKVLDDNGNGQTSWVLAGMEWAAANADVVNMSLGAGPTDGTDPVSLAVNTLTEQHGALFVIAAGNSGPSERSVSAPGSADAALTVGAVDKSDQLANFSSRGPRFGDWAIKPDVTAPGVGIVAARADGTAMGSPVDDHYTSANGTSMATPHVAGAAAILLQQDPQLDPDQVKSALVTTAQPHGGLTVYQQGGGRVDIPTALDTPVLAEPSTLNLGYFAYPHDDAAPVQSEISYTNRGDETVTLDLLFQVSAVQGPPVPGGMLTVEPASLQVAPGETVTSTIDLDVPAVDIGLYSGYLLAEQAGELVTRVPVGFHKEDEMYDVRVTGIDRQGEPASGASNVAILDVENMSRFFRPAFGYVNGEVLVRIPPGTYAILGAILEFDEHQQHLLAATMLGEPEITITGDTELVFDAREANQIDVDTPEHETRPQGGVSFGYWRTAEAPGPLFNPTWGARNTEPAYYAAPTDPVSNGAFEYYSRWELAAPEAELSVVEPTGATLDPYLLRAPAVDGEQVVPVVDAGAGEAADFADLDATGAAVLVSRHSDSLFYMEQEALAAEAGAVALLVANDVPGHMTGYFQEAGTIPTLSLTEQDATLLRDLLSEGGVTVRLDGTAWSDYLYDLILLESDTIPADLRYVLTPQDLTTLEMAYHNDHDGHLMNVGRNWLRPFHSGSQFMHPQIDGPRTRTEYVVGGDEVGYRTIVYGAQPFEARLQEQDFVFYEPGQVAHRSAFRQVVNAGLVPDVEPTTRTGDTLTLRLVEWIDADGNYFPNHTFGLAPYEHDTVTTRVWSGDDLLGTISGFPRGTFPMAAGSADYRVELDVARDVDWWTRSTSTRTEWHFTSQRPVDGTDLVPMMSVSYQVPVDLRNQVPHPRDFRGPAMLDVRVQHQDAGLPEVAGARVWISYDEGDEWQERAVTDRGDGRFRVNLPGRPASGGADAVSVRVEAWDVDGNRVEQEVIRAWHLPTP